MKQIIEAEANRLGFLLSGVTHTEPPPHHPVFERWLATGRHAGMDYLATERSRLRRSGPLQVLPEAKSILSLALPYTPPPSDPSTASDPLQGRIAAYAQGADYHDVIPPRLAQLAETLEKQIGQPVLSRGYTDTGPILERDIAQRAGLGWIGKNTCLIHPRHGSYFLLSEIFLDVELEPDPPFTADHCGSCTRCIDACPTGCILLDRTIDAGRCISYLTIENKGPIDPELRADMGNWIFGCDICQAVCPWNARFAGHPGDPELAPRPGIPAPDLRREIHLTEDEFREKFRGTPLRRAKRRGYLRNAAVALGNSLDPSAVPDLVFALAHEPDPLVRRHIAWALGKIGTHAAGAALERAFSKESDRDVQAEIQAALEASFSR